MENQAISLELVSVMKSSMNIQDVAFVLNENTARKGTFGRFKSEEERKKIVFTIIPNLVFNFNRKLQIKQFLFFGGGGGGGCVLGGYNTVM